MANDFDPWGRPSRKPDNPNQGDQGERPPERDAPPDLDQVIDKLAGIFGRAGRRAGPGKNGGPNGGNNAGMQLPVSAWAMLLFLLVAIALVWLVLGFYSLDEQERGITMRLGKYHSVLDPGLRWQPYFIDTVDKVNVTRVRERQFDSEMLTVDENIVDVKTSVQYVIKDPRSFVLAIRDSEESLTLATDSALRHVVGSTRLDDVITTGREKLAEEVKARLQEYLDSYDSGLQVSRVNILESKAPDEVKGAFDDVIKAREDKVRSTNEATTYENGIVPEARGRAKRMFEEAEGYKDATIAYAEGETQRFIQVAEQYSLAPAVTRERLYLQTIEKVLQNNSKVLVDTGEGSSNVLYLPLDQLRAKIANRVGDGSYQPSVEELANEVIKELNQRQTRNSTSRNSRN